jgi:hypothetical protein
MKESSARRNKRIVAGGCWPTSDQEWLLRAALLRGDLALSAWREWRARLDFNTLDYGSRQLLPILYKNLHALGVDDPLLARFKGVYRHTWFVNQRLFRELAALLERLHAAGVPTMLLKGAALVREYYRDAGLRPMSDVDILVPPREAATAVRILMENGWLPRRKGYASPPERHLLFKNSQCHIRRDDLAIDLHWHVLPECCHPDDDDSLWENATKITVDSKETLCLHPPAQLLHAILHGAKWSPVPPLRWIADAHWIMDRHPHGLDWDFVIAETRRRRMVLPVRRSLRYLLDLLELEVPPAVIVSLSTAAVPVVDRLEYRHRERYARYFTHVPVNWLRFYRLLRSIGHSRRHTGLELLERIRLEWDLAARWQVPFRALIKGIERVIQVLRRII